MRSALLSNGRLAVLLDGSFYIADLYYPHVGRYNHSFGGRFKTGLWHNGKFTWLESIPKRIEMEGLTARMRLWWDGLEVEFFDFVDFNLDVYIRRVSIKGEGYVRVIFYHDFRIMEAPQANTAFYHPEADAVVHYKDRFWFLAGASHPIYEYNVGRRDFGTVLRDCEDGTLEKTPIAQGSVDSAISIAYPNFYYWIAAGQSLSDVLKIHKAVKANPTYYEKRSVGYWKAVTTPYDDRLEAQSIAVLLGHISENGGVVASLDSDILKFNLDTYAYVWPRDASIVAMALDEYGFHAVTRRSFEFMLRHVGPEGYLFQKYNVDGTWGSTWHPWTAAGKNSLNIQEDETAIFIYALWRHIEKVKDFDLLKKAYPAIKAAADFMANFRDRELGLPLQSFDLWEERLGVHLYTTAAVYAALKAAGKLAMMLGEEEDASTWLAAAHTVKEAVSRYMFDEKLGRFVRSIKIEDGKVVEVDRVVDASMIGVALFEMFEPSDPRVVNTVKTIEERLWVPKVGGLARYEGDIYQRVPGDYSQIPGNPWIITTLWLAEYYAMLGNIAKATSLVKWVEAVSPPNYLLPEQLNPFDGSPVSVQPLAWSHAEYLLAKSLLKKAEARKQ
ncbi:glycoside hydrolase family 15 protein [Pyrobaculum ferrireducens]|uniref:Glucan 1,4 alpha-glucosidase (Glucoamylase)-related glycosyl hydrolase n=1 Tax=Pyrobaculum ferrireducens TaxID=1104324 RepID=G7VHX7_9CREN|nr:glycoside hydrolase family 15 protein [Pyrobaculum ferrireducens]AET33337.1 glucan 1,4 alpha-glucosidase (glucoamylase)-related glycosyl hydrolase [Pyrobaculum ferrireducens]